MTPRAAIAFALTAGIALAAGCRDQDSGACPASRDCVSCTHDGCEYCLEDGQCTEPGDAGAPPAHSTTSTRPPTEQSSPQRSGS